MKKSLTIFFVLLALVGKAQSIESISFNLYTDSLKSGTYNYINIDGKYDDGRYLPLMSDEVTFSSSAGRWSGNSLFLDSSCKANSVVITACLKADPALKKKVTIYIKKLSDPPLPTEQEVIDRMRKRRN